MTMKTSKILCIIGIVILIFLFGGSASADSLTLLAPNDGESDVPLNSYFQWQEAPGAVKYVLDIAQFSQSEDNISPSQCSEGVCSFAFISLTAGNINYLSLYNWSITAYNSSGNSIKSSGSQSFITEAEPSNSPPPPPNCTSPNICRSDCPSSRQVTGDCGVGVCCQPAVPGPGDGPGDGSPVDLFGPIQSQSLDDLFNTAINFLLVLAFVIGPLMIVYAGFLILTAAGDAKKMSKAKTIILWTLIALAIILFAKGLTSLVKGALSN